MKVLKEIGKETYGHDGRAINMHSERTYRDGNGNLYVLSKTMDGSFIAVLKSARIPQAVTKA